MAAKNLFLLHCKIFTIWEITHTWGYQIKSNFLFIYKTLFKQFLKVPATLSWRTQFSALVECVQALSYKLLSTFSFFCSVQLAFSHSSHFLNSSITVNFHCALGKSVAEFHKKSHHTLWRYNSRNKQWQENNLKSSNLTSFNVVLLYSYTPCFFIYPSLTFLLYRLSERARETRISLHLPCVSLATAKSS